MSSRQPIRIADLPSFDTIIDARSPAEFALDHIPGAINCPALDNEQRRIVGTLYKQVGAFEAKRVGSAMVAENLARHLSGTFANQPAHWQPLVYCWRGGLRSGSMVTWLRLVGWDAQPLSGGYKAWRRHVIATIDNLAPRAQWRVVCGATGSAKTRVLQAIEAQGGQVLDLEHLARHKGSLLGAIPHTSQPSQKCFETQLAHRLQSFDLSRPVYVEGESPRIGQIRLPVALVAGMRAAPCVEVSASHPARLAYLLRDYAYLADNREQLARQLGYLRALHGGARVEQWQRWALAGELAPLFHSLMETHYDPSYQRSQARHFRQWQHRQVLDIEQLDTAAIHQLAERVMGLDTAPGAMIDPM